jgi:hypothetical protein
MSKIFHNLKSKAHIFIAAIGSIAITTVMLADNAIAQTAIPKAPDRN